MPRIAAFPAYPSVTEIIRACGLSRGSEHIPDRYRERGRALHAAVEMYLAGLDVGDLAPELRPGMAAFLEFQERENGFLCWHSELELVHPYGYVGHVDLVGTIGPDPAPAIIDLKYSDSPDIKGAMWQIAGYRMLFDHNHPETKTEKGYVLQLSPTSGKPKLIDVTDEYAITVFTSALIVYKAREYKR